MPDIFYQVQLYRESLQKKTKKKKTKQKGTRRRSDNKEEGIYRKKKSLTLRSEYESYFTLKISVKIKIKIKTEQISIAMFNQFFHWPNTTKKIVLNY